VPLNIIHVEADAAEEFYGAKLLLVRPDQHVAWRGDEMPGNVTEIINLVIGG
jgi:hypothetical protein